MIAESAKVFARVIPEQFRDPGFVVRGNLIFKKDTNGNLLPGVVGQLEEGVELDHIRKIAGSLSQVGDVAAVVGAVASVINLGVCVVGFLHVSRSLKQVERRLGGIDKSFERIEGMLGIIDQKIDQLLYLNNLQLHALSNIAELIKSYEVAKVHAALETLDFKLQNADTPEADHNVRGAIETLQVYRTWLSDQRHGSDIPIPVRTELLRAEVLVTLAECRARCFVGEQAYAVSCLKRSVESAREEALGAWNRIIEAHGMRSLFSYNGEGEGNWIDIYMWINSKNLESSSNQLLRNMANESIFDTTKGEIIQAIEGIKEDLDSIRFAVIPASFPLNLISLPGATKDQQDVAFDAHISSFKDKLYVLQDKISTMLADIQGDDDENGGKKILEQGNKVADIASLALCYRLARNLEAALACCATMEVGGEPARQLLWAKEDPDSPAIALEVWNPVEAD